MIFSFYQISKSIFSENTLSVRRPQEQIGQQVNFVGEWRKILVWISQVYPQ